jgi:phage regulator Rha-like protein
MKTKQLAKIDGIIEIDHGKPMVSSLTIASEFGRRHKHVLTSIDGLVKSGTLTGPGLRPSEYIDESGKSNRMYLLDERSSLISMPFIGGKKAKEGQSRLVDAYLHYRDNFKEPPRKELVRAKRDEHGPMTDMLKFTRELMEKATVKHHYENENLFCNRALTGKWEPLDESTLDNYDITLLAAIRRRNTMLIAHFLKQADRKGLMDDFVIGYRAKHPRLTLATLDGKLLEQK